jgi:uracil-DNA glycosylase
MCHTPSSCSIFSLCRCTRCPRLVSYRNSIKGKGKHAEWKYWNKPVPGFGDPLATILIVGLAPGAHGANRTGRPFTGDAAGELLFKALYDCGKGSTGTGTHRGDTLVLKGIFITNIIKCVPPGNLPSAEEIRTCMEWFDCEIHTLRHIQTIVCLGGLAFDAVRKRLIRFGSGNGVLKNARFVHNVQIDPGDGLPRIVGLYHPSRRNVNTGLLSLQSFSRSIRAVCQDA